MSVDNASSNLPDSKRSAMDGMYWVMFMSSIAGWRMHPGYQKEGSSPPPSMSDSARLADEMLAEYKKRFGE